MEFKIVNWNIGGAKYLEKKKKERENFRKELNNELRTLIKKHNPHVVTLQEIVLYGEPVLSWNEITGKILDTYKQRFMEFLKIHPKIQIDFKNDWIQELIEKEVKSTQNVVISNGSKSLSIELNKEKSKALLRIDNNEVEKLIAETKDDIVYIFSEIKNIIDPIDKYRYYPFKLIDTHDMSAQAKWNKVKKSGGWDQESYFAQGNAMLFKEENLSFPIWDLSASGFRPNPTTRHFVEQVHLQRGLYFGNRDTEPRAAIVTHLIFDPDDSNAFYWNDIQNRDRCQFLDFLNRKLNINLDINSTKIDMIDDEIRLSEYLFSWNRIEEINEKDRFFGYLKTNFGNELEKELATEEYNDKIIIFSNIEKSAKIVIERINGKINLKINDGTEYELFAIKENEDEKIYHNNKIALKLNKEKNEAVLRISSIKDRNIEKIEFIAKREDNNKFKIIYGKPLDVFVVNLHLTTLTNEREGIPDIDGKASKIRLAQIDTVFEGIVSQYNLWKQQGFHERGEQRPRSPGETFKRQSPVWIIAGDFNFTPEAIEYETIRRMNFIDVLPNKGTGSKAKGMGEKATLTLDYIFAGPLYTALDPVDTLNAIKANGPPDYTVRMSDHYPLIATIIMGKEV